MIPELIIYLLKVNLALLLFYGGYQLFLKHYTFYSLNRIYLLLALVYSSLYPLINLEDLFQNNIVLQEQISSISPDWQSSITYIINQSPGAENIYWQFSLYIFWTGVLMMSLRLIIQLISLLILHRQSEVTQTGEYQFRLIHKKLNPFSFWRTIYINPEYHQAQELESILKHEQVHVRQLHSLDVLLAEISLIFFWFNPGAWLMKKAIQANLEYITDQQVLKSGIDSKAYQYALLKINILPQNILPVNNFHLLSIKKRIAMMNKKPTSRINRGIYLLILSAVILTSLFATTSKATLKDSSIDAVISQLPEIPEMITLDAGLIKETVNILKKPLVSTKAKTQTDTNKVKNKVIIIRETGAVGDSTGSKKPIYIVDGLVVKNIKQIDPENIESIRVLKGAASTASYGAAGSEGVIEISTKPKALTFEPTTQGAKDNSIKNQDAKISLKGLNNQELILLDGVEVDRSILKDLSVSSIRKMEVFKAEEAVKKFGEKGRNGVIALSTMKQD